MSQQQQTLTTYLECLLEVSFMPIWILDIKTQGKEQVFSMFLLDFAACTEISWELNSYCLPSMHQSFFARTSYGF